MGSPALLETENRIILYYNYYRGRQCIVNQFLYIFKKMLYLVCVQDECLEMVHFRG